MNIRKTVNGTEIKLKMILRKILDEIHYNWGFNEMAYSWYRIDIDLTGNWKEIWIGFVRENLSSRRGGCPIKTNFRAFL